MERNFLNDMNEGLGLLEELTTKISGVVDQINAGVEDINTSDDLFTRLSGAMAVEIGLCEVQKSCRAFDAKFKKLQKERDKA